MAPAGTILGLISAFAAPHLTQYNWSGRLGITISVLFLALSIALMSAALLGTGPHGSERFVEQSTRLSVLSFSLGVAASVFFVLSSFWHS